MWYSLNNVSSHPPQLSKKFHQRDLSSKEHNVTASAIGRRYHQELKVQYRKLLLTHALAQIDDSSLTASEITKSVHILAAIRWVEQAWDAVKEETVVNCFRHCGMQATVTEPTEDPFADLDENKAQLKDLVNNFIQMTVDCE